MRSKSARIAYAVGVAAVIAIAGCYDIPQPECGFTCGPPAVEGGEGTCPDGYVCFTSLDNRCHRVSPPFTDPCPGDASIPPDLKPPLLMFRSPAPDSIEVPIATVGSVEVAFDEQVFNIIDFPNFAVDDGSGFLSGTVVELGFQSDNLVHYRWQASPELPFRADTVHTVQLTTGITDSSGNAFLGDQWTFKTAADNTPPTATVEIPVVMTNVPLETRIDVRFSEPVLGVTLQTFTVTGPSGIVSGSLNMSLPNFASLDPFSLQPDTQYTVNLSNTITDLAGNALVFTPFVFTTAADTSRPMVINTTPMTGSINISVLASITANFSEAVSNANSSTFTLTGPSGVEPALITTSPSQAILNPTHQLAPMTTYTISLTSGIVDAANNQLFPFTGTFTTGTDVIAPGVIGRVPLPNTSGVGVNSVVHVDFDEDITNADATTIQLMNGGLVPATVTYQGFPTFRATLTPSVQLAPMTTYTVILSPTLQDASGNMLGTPPGTWSFFTGADTFPPSITATMPADNATDVPLAATISVTFDEPVTGVDGTSFVVMNAGTGTLASSNGGRTWTFTPDAPMPANTTVTIMLTMAIEDGAGNDLAPFTFDFTTVP
ncbi:MAG: Ig-like domain-containing protein [Kofleriaceae bacterium]